MMHVRVVYWSTALAISYGDPGSDPGMNQKHVWLFYFLMCRTDSSMRKASYLVMKGVAWFFIVQPHMHRLLKARVRVSVRLSSLSTARKLLPVPIPETGRPT